MELGRGFELEPARDGALLTLGFERVELPAYESGLTLPRLMETSSAVDDVYFCQDGEGWLLISSLRDNPIVRRDGQLPVEDHALRRIRRVSEAGILFDHHAVVHVLPSHFSPHAPARVPLRLSRRAGRPRPRATSQRLANATTLIASAGSLARSAAALCAASGLDPVLLGGVAHHSSERVIWYEVARWGEDG